MKTMIAAFVALFVIAMAADLALDHAGFSTEEQTSGPTVRLS